MRKYIDIAKVVTPVLTEEAANHIAEEYSRLRSQEQLGSDVARVSRTQKTRFDFQKLIVPHSEDMSSPSHPSDLSSDGPYSGDSHPSVHGTCQGPHQQGGGAGGHRSCG